MSIVGTVALFLLAYCVGSLSIAHNCDTDGKFYANGWYSCKKMESKP